MHVDLLIRIGGASDPPLGHRSNAVYWFRKVRMRLQFPSALAVWLEKEQNEGFGLLIQHTKMTSLECVYYLHNGKAELRSLLRSACAEATPLSVRTAYIQRLKGTEQVKYKAFH